MGLKEYYQETDSNYLRAKWIYTEDEVLQRKLQEFFQSDFSQQIASLLARPADLYLKVRLVRSYTHVIDSLGAERLAIMVSNFAHKGRNQMGTIQESLLAMLAEYRFLKASFEKLVKII